MKKRKKSELNSRDRYEATENMKIEPTLLSENTIKIVAIVGGFLYGLLALGIVALLFWLTSTHHSI